MSLSKRWLEILISSFFLLFFGTLATALFFSRELRILRKNVGSYHQFVQTLCSRPEIIVLSLPEQFGNVPFGEQTGLVIGSKNISIRGDLYPYNASIARKGSNGYHLVFRYDEIDEDAPLNSYSHLGYAELDAQFNQTEKEFVQLSTYSRSPEDPRILSTKDRQYLIFNDYGLGKSLSNRYMYMGELDLDRLTVQNLTCFNPCLSSVEKNWVPFEYVNTNGESEIYFEYSISPLKLLKVDTEETSSVAHVFTPREFKDSYWPKIWGKIRGGTTAQMVDGQYLAFFHSSFKDKKGILWYSMGAYTFEPQPPFRLTAISHYPILFDQIYTSPCMNTADPMKRVIFPCSYVVEKTEKGDAIHISCGENDSTVKIVTLDKNVLLRGLKKIKLKK